MCVCLIIIYHHHYCRQQLNYLPKNCWPYNWRRLWETTFTSHVVFKLYLTILYTTHCHEGIRKKWSNMIHFFHHQISHFIFIYEQLFTFNIIIILLVPHYQLASRKLTYSLIQCINYFCVRNESKIREEKPSRVGELICSRLRLPEPSYGKRRKNYCNRVPSSAGLMYPLKT